MKSCLPLQEGDQIRIIAPAKAIEKEFVDYAQQYLESKGFHVTISDHCLGQYNYFSGTIHERLEDLQTAIDDPEVKAILCARGGYGCIQLVDKVDWSRFNQSPKWIIGFSDITVLHQHLQHAGIQSIHGTMPLNFRENTADSFRTLLAAIQNQPYIIHAPGDPFNVPGRATGHVIGGNLSIVYSLLGTNIAPDYSGAILFVEDLAEHIYHIDRIFHALDKASILKNLSGLIVGGMTNIKDTQIPYGSSYEEVILSHLSKYDIPVCFNFPAGHIDDNRALCFGRQAVLEVTKSQTLLTFTE